MVHDSARTDPLYLFRSLTDNKGFVTRADAIRKQHRGKKRKTQHIKLSILYFFKHVIINRKCIRQHIANKLFYKKALI